MDAKQVSKVFLAVVAAAVILPGGAAKADVRYTVTEFGYDGWYSAAYEVNSAGQVLGSQRDGSDPLNPVRDFLWDADAGLLDLTSLLEEGSRVRGMNDLGQFIVERDSPETGEDGAYLWDGQTAPQYLGAFSPDKLSNNGRVVGDTPWSPDGPPRTGVVWDSASGLREIPPLPGGSWTETRAINNLGQIVGICDTDVPWVGHPVGGSFRGPPDVQQHAFVWDENGGTIDLGTLGGDDCWGSGINDLGQVAGTSYTGNGAEYRAFLWDPVEGMRDLGPAPGDGSSRAGDINNAGQVIGEYRDRAAIWDPVHGVQEILDLIPPDTGWTYFVPYDINDAGQIAGYRIISWGFDPETGEYEYYDRRAVLLTPVPEPVGLSIWGASLGALVTLKRRRAGSRTHP